MAIKRRPAAKRNVLSKTIGGKRFTKVSCSSTKTAAKKVADGIRAKGGTARVVKTGSAHCVYKGARSKTKKTRRKARA